MNLQKLRACAANVHALKTLLRKRNESVDINSNDGLQQPSTLPARRDYHSMIVIPQTPHCHTVDPSPSRRIIPHGERDGLAFPFP